jgi:hypothetical protein
MPLDGRRFPGKEVEMSARNCACGNGRCERDDRMLVGFR